MDAKTLVGFADRPHRLGDGTHVVKGGRLAGQRVEYTTPLREQGAGSNAGVAALDPRPREVTKHKPFTSDWLKPFDGG
jgi:hypothetical protein